MKPGSRLLPWEYISAGCFPTETRAVFSLFDALLYAREYESHGELTLFCYYNAELHPLDSTIETISRVRASPFNVLRQFDASQTIIEIFYNKNFLSFSSHACLFGDAISVNDSSSHYTISSLILIRAKYPDC